jgi:catechol 2,3-dioxygenase-like lactoylglutathione lyase family enzyme
MKRIHVHVAVKELATSVDFYSKLFGASPSKRQTDYAKRMLDEPRVNFAISARGHDVSVNHFGFQAELPDELAALKARAEAASEGTVLDQGEAACCYAKSEKHWTVDPHSLAWEHFLTMSDALTFGEAVAMQAGACRIPVKESAAQKSSGGACCIPNEESSAKTGGCACPMTDMNRVRPLGRHMLDKGGQ